MSVAPTLSAGDTAPDFTLQDTKGNKVTLSSFSGKKVYMVLFRPSACPMCNLHLSRIKKHAATLKAAGLEILPVFESTPNEMKSFGKKMREERVLDIAVRAVEV